MSELKNLLNAIESEGKFPPKDKFRPKEFREYSQKSIVENFGSITDENKNRDLGGNRYYVRSAGSSNTANPVVKNHEMTNNTYSAQPNVTRKILTKDNTGTQPHITNYVPASSSTAAYGNVHRKPTLNPRAKLIEQRRVDLERAEQNMQKRYIDQQQRQQQIENNAHTEYETHGTYPSWWGEPETVRMPSGQEIIMASPPKMKANHSKNQNIVARGSHPTEEELTEEYLQKLAETRDGAKFRQDTNRPGALVSNVEEYVQDKYAHHIAKKYLESNNHGNEIVRIDENVYVGDKENVSMSPIVIPSPEIPTCKTNLNYSPAKSIWKKEFPNDWFKQPRRIEDLNTRDKFRTAIEISEELDNLNSNRKDLKNDNGGYAFDSIDSAAKRHAELNAVADYYQENEDKFDRKEKNDIYNGLKNAYTESRKEFFENAKNFIAQTKTYGTLGPNENGVKVVSRVRNLKGLESEGEHNFWNDPNFPGDGRENVNMRNVNTAQNHNYRTNPNDDVLEDKSHKDFRDFPLLQERAPEAMLQAMRINEQKKEQEFLDAKDETDSVKERKDLAYSAVLNQAFLKLNKQIYKDEQAAESELELARREFGARKVKNRSFSENDVSANSNKDRFLKSSDEHFLIENVNNSENLPPKTPTTALLHHYENIMAEAHAIKDSMGDSAKEIQLQADQKTRNMRREEFEHNKISDIREYSRNVYSELDKKRVQAIRDRAGNVPIPSLNEETRLYFQEQGLNGEHNVPQRLGDFLDSPEKMRNLEQRVQNYTAGYCQIDASNTDTNANTNKSYNTRTLGQIEAEELRNRALNCRKAQRVTEAVVDASRKHFDITLGAQRKVSELEGLEKEEREYWSKKYDDLAHDEWKNRNNFFTPEDDFGNKNRADEDGDFKVGRRDLMEAYKSRHLGSNLKKGAKKQYVQSRKVESKSSSKDSFHDEMEARLAIAKARRGDSSEIANTRSGLKLIPEKIDWEGNGENGCDETKNCNSDGEQKFPPMPPPIDWEEVQIVNELNGK